MRASTTIGVPPGSRVLRITEEHTDGHTAWHVWFSMSPCGRYGQYVELRDDGSIHRYSVQPDGESCMEIKPPSGRD